MSHRFPTPKNGNKKTHKKNRNSGSSVQDASANSHRTDDRPAVSADPTVVETRITCRVECPDVESGLAVIATQPPHRPHPLVAAFLQTHGWSAASDACQADRHVTVAEEGARDQTVQALATFPSSGGRMSRHHGDEARVERGGARSLVHCDWAAGRTRLH